MVDKDSKCACGCGKTLSIPEFPCRTRRYIHGHNKTSSNSKGERIKVVCSECNKEFEILPSRFKGSQKYYCCRECYFLDKEYLGHCAKIRHSNRGKVWSEARRKAQEFVKNKGWGGNRKTFKKNRLEYPSNWNEIRKKIYIRDKWTCRECGQKCHGNGTKDKIQCHHIDYNSMNNSEYNLITLCSSCHCKTNFKRNDWKSYLSMLNYVPYYFKNILKPEVSPTMG